MKHAGCLRKGPQQRLNRRVPCDRLSVVRALPARFPLTLWALTLALAASACGSPGGTGSEAPRAGSAATTSRTTPAGGTGPANAGRFNLGSHSYKVTTSSPEAQRAFDRGLTLAYGFSHGEAEREFRRAAELDPRCAMAWWGVALSTARTSTFRSCRPTRPRGLGGADKARELAPGASDTERALIEALARRYANPQPEDRRPLDEAYAAAMREVWKAHPQDADVAPSSRKR